MDKYLKIFEPAMKKWLAEHYSQEEAKRRWERNNKVTMGVFRLGEKK